MCNHFLNVEPMDICGASRYLFQIFNEVYLASVSLSFTYIPCGALVEPKQLSCP